MEYARGKARTIPCQDYRARSTSTGLTPIVIDLPNGRKIACGGLDR